MNAGLERPLGTYSLLLAGGFFGYGARTSAPGAMTDRPR